MKHIQTEQAPKIDYTSHWHRQKPKKHLKEKNEIDRFKKTDTYPKTDTNTKILGYKR